MPDFYLGNGDDELDYDTVPSVDDLTPGSRVFGQDGNDNFRIGSPIGFIPDDILLSGGNGNDTFFAIGGADNIILGGNGDDEIIGELPYRNTWAGGRGNDTLGVYGSSNTLWGGPGDDLLFSIGHDPGLGTLPGDDILPGNILIGGSGQDTFQMRATVSTPYSVPDRACGDPDVLDNGDVVIGPMDVITDYQKGELIDLPDPAKAISEVRLNDRLRDDHEIGLPELVRGQYAALRGDLTEPSHFEVSSGGGDILILYGVNNTNGEFPAGDPTEIGALVILGVSCPDEVLIG